MKNKNTRFALPAVVILGSLLLGGCSSNGFSDINAWMSEQNKNAKGKIEPLPPAKTYTPTSFVAKQNPFEEKEALSLSKLDSNKYAPDVNRRKEPLESYTLDAVKMVGFLNSSTGPSAIINTADKKIHNVGIGNHMGKNFGQITKITEGQIILEERVVGGDGAWVIKEAVVSLDDGSKRK